MRREDRGPAGRAIARDQRAGRIGRRASAPPHAFALRRRTARAMLEPRARSQSNAGRHMPSPVTLERYVGPALHVHGHGAVVIHEGGFAAGLVIPCHVHADPVVSLVLDGDGAEEVGGRTRLVTAQDLLLTPAYAVHGYR